MNKKSTKNNNEINELQQTNLQNKNAVEEKLNDLQYQIQETNIKEENTKQSNVNENDLNIIMNNTTQNLSTKVLKKQNKKHKNDTDQNSMLNEKPNIELDISKKVILIVATVFLALALMMFILSIRGCIALITNNAEGLAILGIAMAKIVVIGCFCFPGLLANLIAIVTSLFTIKTTIPAQKKWSISLIIVSIIIFIVYLTLTILALTAK